MWFFLKKDESYENVIYQEIENFDSSIHTFNNVLGSASFFEGVDEIKIKPPKPK